MRVNGLAPATVVKGSSMFPRERVIASLLKYGLDYSEDEETEILRNRLAEFYAQRTLTKAAISPEDQAEVAYLLISDAFSKTTGQVINVDGGLSEGFLALADLNTEDTEVIGCNTGVLRLCVREFLEGRERRNRDFQ